MADTPISRLAEASALDGNELVVVSQQSPVVRISAATISALAADQSFNDSGNGFLTAGFAVDDYVNVTGFTGDDANNIYSAQITALTAGKMTIGGAEGAVIVDDAEGETVVISKWTSRRAEYGGGGGSDSGFDLYGSAWAISPRYNSDTPTIAGESGVVITNTVARTFATTNQFTKRKRTGVTITGGSAFGQIRPSNAVGVAGVGTGWRYRCRFGVVTTATNGRILVGCSGGWNGSTDPSATAAMNGFMVGCDSLDANLQLIRGNRTSVVKTNLGAAFPARTSSADRYEVILWTDAGDTFMHYYVKNLTTGAIAEGSFDTVIPGVNSFESFGFWAGTNGTAGLSLDFFGMDYKQRRDDDY